MSKMRKYEPLFLTLNPRIHGNLCIEQRYFGAPEKAWTSHHMYRNILEERYRCRNREKRKKYAHTADKSALPHRRHADDHRILIYRSSATFRCSFLMKFTFSRLVELFFTSSCGFWFPFNENHRHETQKMYACMWGGGKEQRRGELM